MRRAGTAYDKAKVLLLRGLQRALRPSRDVAAAEQPHLPIGEQYSDMEGLLDPAYPFISFVVELPFELSAPVPRGMELVIPMADIRTGEQEDTEVRLRIGVTKRPLEFSAAPIDYLLSLPGRSGQRYARLQAAQRSVAPPPREHVTIVELTTPNRLTEVSPETCVPEIAVRLFLRCLHALNRFLGAYIVATEDPAVRTLTQEALGHYVLAELRSQRHEPLGYAGVLTMPKVTPPSPVGLSPRDLRIRLQTSLDHESFRHPMDVVVQWEVRARHYSHIVGDLEIALLALNVSTEVLIDALWCAHKVDDGQDSSLYDKLPRQFKKALTEVTVQLGDPWTSKSTGGVWADYVQDCYDLRNDTTHEGRHVDVEEIDAAFAAYSALRRAVEARTMATAERYPRTAILIHGPAGLRKHGAIRGRVEETLRDITSNREISFWLPWDLR